VRKVEDVTTIIKQQSLTSVRPKDCTLRFSNKTNTLFLCEYQEKQSSFMHKMAWRTTKCHAVMMIAFRQAIIINSSAAFEAK